MSRDARMQQRWGAAALAIVLGIIALASLIPESQGAPQETIQSWTNAGHAPAYAALFLCAMFVLRPRFGSHANIVLVAALAAIAFGVAMELLQSVVGRTVSFSDAAINTIGVGLGVGVWMAIRPRLPGGISAPRED